MCLPRLAALSAPFVIAHTSLSEPHDVKQTSCAWQPSAAAICERAVSRYVLASRPFVCVELGFP